jgi:2-haloacid dehalogenase
MIEPETGLITHRPAVVAFDVIETLFSLESLRPRLGAIGLPAPTLEAWFAQLLRDAFALDCVGKYLPFRDIAAATLERLLHKASIEYDDKQLSGVIDGFTQLEAHPDVASAMATLRNGGIRIVTLSNGSARATEMLLERAELRKYVERSVSIDEVKRWKPAREVYLHCAEVVGISPDRMALVAAHGWDIQGAKRAGLTAAYIERNEGPFLSVFDAPDVTGTTLGDVVDQLSGLSA